MKGGEMDERNGYGIPGNPVERPVFIAYKEHF